MFEEGTYIVRIFPSGTTTMGNITHCAPAYAMRKSDGMFFKAIESYDMEGGVKSGNCYGRLDKDLQLIGQLTIRYRHRLATESEIKCFIDYGSIRDKELVKKYNRELTIDKVLND